MSTFRIHDTGISRGPLAATASPPPPSTPAARRQRGGAALRALLWMAVGAALAVLLVADPLGISPVDGWLGIGPATAAAPAGGGGQAAGGGQEKQLWTCGMHPQVIQDHPGTCPICGMDLVPLRQDAGAPAAAPAAHDHGQHGESGEQEKQLWTCGMHPQVIQDHPGTCPICGMDLVPLRQEAGAPAAAQAGGAPKGERKILFYRNPMDPTITSPVPRKDEMGMDYLPVYADEVEAAASQGAVVTIDPAVVQNMNVTTEAVTRRDIHHRIRTVGYLDYDQERIVSVTTKYAGFVEKVHVNYVGETVKKGQPLFEVYSPELVQTEQELLSAVRYADGLAEAAPEARERARKLVAAARARLAYWDITRDQVDRLIETGKVFRTLTVVAPASGILMDRMEGLEGMAIRPGMEAMRIVDLGNLWLTVEVFEDQLPWVNVGSPATVELTYFPGETFRGRVRYIEPEVSEKTRTLKLTLDVPNPGGRLRVGMYATVIFEPTAARDAIAVPSHAVLRTGERDVVIVALGGGRFAPREVVLGPEGDGWVQVLRGLEEGEEIVTSAQFLIDSESNLREAIQKMIAERQKQGGGGR